MKKNNSPKVEVIKIKADNIMDLLNAIMSDELDKAATSEECKEISVTVEKAIDNIAKKKGWTPQRVNGWLGGIEELSPIAAFDIVARELAIELDKKYEDHIEESEKIFIISPLDGVIHEVCKKCIKNYRNFPAFRTAEDAKMVCTLLRGKLKGMFKNAKRK